jgi:hypothetical protein
MNASDPKVMLDQGDRLEQRKLITPCRRPAQGWHRVGRNAVLDLNP